MMGLGTPHRPLSTGAANATSHDTGSIRAALVDATAVASVGKPSTASDKPGPVPGTDAGSRVGNATTASAMPPLCLPCARQRRMAARTRQRKRMPTAPMQSPQRPTQPVPWRRTRGRRLRRLAPPSTRWHSGRWWGKSRSRRRSKWRHRPCRHRGAPPMRLRRVKTAPVLARCPRCSDLPMTVPRCCRHRRPPLAPRPKHQQPWTAVECRPTSLQVPMLKPCPPLRPCSTSLTLARPTRARLRSAVAAPRR